MKIVIDMPEDVYEEIMAHNRELRESGKSAYYLEGLIQNGTPLPEGHGDLIDRKELLKQPMDLANYPSNYVQVAPTIIEADKGE